MLSSTFVNQLPLSSSGGMHLLVTTVFRTRKQSPEKVSDKSKGAATWQTLCSPASEPASCGRTLSHPASLEHVLGCTFAEGTHGASELGPEARLGSSNAQTGFQAAGSMRQSTPRSRTHSPGAIPLSGSPHGREASGLPQVWLSWT